MVVLIYPLYYVMPLPFSVFFLGFYILPMAFIFLIIHGIAWMVEGRHIDKEEMHHTDRAQLYCRHCGHLVDADSEYCKYCGKKL